MFDCWNVVGMMWWVVIDVELLVLVVFWMVFDV